MISIRIWGLEEPEEPWLLRKSPKLRWMGQRKSSLGLSCCWEPPRMETHLNSPSPNPQKELLDNQKHPEDLGRAGWSRVTGGDGSVPVRGDFFRGCLGTLGARAELPTSCSCPWFSPGNLRVGRRQKSSCGFLLVPTLRRVLRYWLGRG